MFSTNKVYAAYVALAVLVFAIGYFFSLPHNGPTTQIGFRTVHLDGQVIRVSVAETDAERQLGLGTRDGLAPDEGMLFVFPEDGVYAFWMRDMKFSIDIVWISLDGKIIYIQSDVSPDTFPKTFGPQTPARYVLELPAKYAVQHGVRVGDEVQF